MKKLFSLMTTLMMASTALMTLTSCDDDSRKAFTLDGTWTGTIGTYYSDRWGINGNTLHTAIHFNMTDPWGGNGYEVDYDTRTPFANYYYCEFTWSVNEGVIRIRYKDNWDEIRIYDYELEVGGYFQGYMDDGRTNNIYFRLHYDSRFDWSPYQGGPIYAPATRAATGENIVSGDGYFAKGIFAEKMKERE
ncbi:MAG: hypothetical protein IJ659_05355 [Alloprevotella sp.]|nr:hypothetical protein [Alloprevotella sp.]